jgi:ubiquinone/menaquinone biosynthesis C-methylase UbiE
MASPLAAPGPWDLVASAYALEVVPQFEHFARDALRIAGVAPGARVVDVACGPGTLSTLAARAGYEVSSLDFSEKMIAELRSRIDAEGLAAKIDARVGDGMALPYADRSFAGGFSMFGLMFFPDRDKGFRELLRVVEPGAPVVVSSWPTLDRVPMLGEAFAVLSELLPPPPNAPPMMPPLTKAEACVAEMSAAGFRDVVVHEVSWPTPAVTPAEHWALMERTSAPFVLRKTSLGERWTPISDAIRERMRAKFGDAPISMPLPALLTVGSR